MWGEGYSSWNLPHKSASVNFFWYLLHKRTKKEYFIDIGKSFYLIEISHLYYVRCVNLQYLPTPIGNYSKKCKIINNLKLLFVLYIFCNSSTKVFQNWEIIIRFPFCLLFCRQMGKILKNNKSHENRPELTIQSNHAYALCEKLRKSLHIIFAGSYTDKLIFSKNMKFMRNTQLQNSGNSMFVFTYFFRL